MNRMRYVLAWLTHYLTYSNVRVTKNWKDEIGS